MKELDPAVFLSVFQEMLGPALWLLLALAGAIVIAFVLFLLRDGRLVSRRFLWSELAGIVGGIGAVLFMQAVTHSSFGDIGGPIDAILVALIWLTGAVGTTLLAYVVLSGLGGRPATR